MINIQDILNSRLANQCIAGTKFKKPAELVKWMGAIQAQDFAGAKWGAALRLQNTDDAAIEKAFNEGSILRTHVLRPTWHFVSPDDIRWMLHLTAPRVNAFGASMYRKMELDDTIFKQTGKALKKALRGGKHLTRPELAFILKQAGIETDDLLRFTMIMMRAELDAVVCSGVKRDKQFTYALLDERVPQTKIKKHDEALAELALRYFISHGPAELQDFTWWSGLSAADARKGLEIIKPQLIKEVVNGTEYWMKQSASPIKAKPQAVYLLPAFDEYTVAYKNRSIILDAACTIPPGSSVLNPVIVADGKIIGTWKRTFKKDNIIVETNLFKPITKSLNERIVSAAKLYGGFIGRKIERK
jgi:hypothetical protein